MKKSLIIFLIVSVSLFTSCDIELNRGGSLLDNVEHEINIKIPGMTSENPYSVKTSDELINISHQTDLKEFYVRLEADIRLQNNPDADDYGVLILSGDKIMHLDLNGHRISEKDGDITRTAANGNGETQIMINVLDGATLDISNSSSETAYLGGEYDENPSSRIITATDGNLIIGGDIVIQMFSISNGGAIFANGKSNVILNSGLQVYASNFALNTSASTGKTIINGGTYASIATNKFYNGKHFAYTLLVGGSFEINDCVVYGGQGGISATGNGVINGGKSTTTVKILDYVPEAYRRMYNKYHVSNTGRDDSKEYQVADGEIWHAVYCAGEFAQNPQLVINGGTFRTDGIANAKAIYVGNSNDGGNGLYAVAEIKGGVFDGRIYVDTRNPAYGYGKLSLMGGRFSATDAEIAAYLAAGYVIEGPDSEGYYSVVIAE